MTIADLEREFYSNRENASRQVRGTATAPAAGAAVATLAAPPAGFYEITVLARYGGTADVIDNMELKVGATSILVLPVLPVANGSVVPIKVLVKLDGASAVTVNAIALGGAGSVFVAHIIATKLGD